MSDWYYSNEGRQLGPVTREALRRLATEGVLKATDMIWKQGMPDWIPASSAKGLIPSAAPNTKAPSDSADAALPARTTLESVPPAEPARTTLEALPPASAYTPSAPAEPARTTLESLPSANPQHAVSADPSEPRRAPQPTFTRGSNRLPSDPLPAPIKQGGGKKLLFGILGGIAVLLISGGVLLFVLLRPGSARSFSVAQGDSTEMDVEFQKGKWIEVAIETDSDADLDLFIFDNEGARVAVDQNAGNACLVEFFPNKTQTYRLEIRCKHFNDPFAFDDDYVSGTVKWKIRDISELSEVARKAPDKIDETLNFTDRNGNNGPIIRDYLFHMDKKNAYTLEMFSRFDNRITVKDLYGEVVSGMEKNQGRNARIFFQPKETGVYKVVAGSMHGHNTGPFRLSVRPKTAVDATNRSFMIHPFDRHQFEVALRQGELTEVALKEPLPNVTLRVLDLTNRQVSAIDASDAKVLFVPAKSQSYRVEIASRGNQGGAAPVAVVQWQAKAMDDLVKLSRKAPDTINAKLANNDPQMTPGKYQQSFLFHMDADKTYTIEMLSGFDNYVAVKDLSDVARIQSDLGQPATNTRLFFQPKKSGVFKVVAATSRGFQTGQFILAVRPKTAQDDTSRSFRLTGGQTSRFNVPMTKGALMEVALKEKLGNVDLRVLDGGNKPVASLDAGAAIAKVLFVPSVTRSYRVEVANRNGFGGVPLSGTVVWKTRQLADIAKLARQAPVKIDSTLDRNDRRSQSGQYYKSFLVYLEGKQTYTFDVFGAFDNYVQVKDLSGTPLATSSLSTATANSRMFYQPSASGVYQVAAGSISSISSSRTNTMTINVRKKLTTDDRMQPFLLKTRSQRAQFHITPERGKSVLLSVRTTNTNKVSIRVYGSSSRFRSLGNADTVNGVASLTITPNSSDTSLRVEVSNRNLSDAAPAAGFVSWQAGSAIAGGNTRPSSGPKVVLSQTSALAPGGLTYNRTKYARLYTVYMSSTKTYTIDMSSIFDNYLVLQTVAGRFVRSDDDSGTGRNARIVYRPTVSGVYRIIATSFSSGQRGTFTLRVTSN